MYPFYLGIDLHLKRTYMVLMDAKGEIINKGCISSQEITKYLQEKVPQETYAVLEATRNWPTGNMSSCPSFYANGAT